VVQVQFSIGDGGTVTGAVYKVVSTWHDTDRVFKAEVESVFSQAHLPSECRGFYTLTYRFLLNEEKSGQPNTTIARNDAEFVVRANHEVITCVTYSVEKPSRRKRLSAKLHGKPTPPTIVVQECH